MTLRRSWGVALSLSLAGALLFQACSRKKPAEINPIEPSISFSRTRVPLGSAVEVTYTWKLDPAAKKLAQDHRAMVHVLDSHEAILFAADHTPVPPVTEWFPARPTPTRARSSSRSTRTWGRPRCAWGCSAAPAGASAWRSRARTSA